MEIRVTIPTIDDEGAENNVATVVLERAGEDEEPLVSIELPFEKRAVRVRQMDLLIAAAACWPDSTSTQTEERQP